MGATNAVRVLGAVGIRRAFGPMGTLYALVRGGTRAGAGPRRWRGRTVRVQNVLAEIAGHDAARARLDGLIALDDFLGVLRQAKGHGLEAVRLAAAAAELTRSDSQSSAGCWPPEENGARSSATARAERRSSCSCASPSGSTAAKAPPPQNTAWATEAPAALATARPVDSAVARFWSAWALSACTSMWVKRVCGRCAHRFWSSTSSRAKCPHSARSAALAGASV